ncbi:carboxymuconolactone decarboxylase family protein [Vibrio parahaemolyticus]|uniref:carboxymuconolactone decarboxylase family protein n=1 Tax=Vibrio parahaemolyticus TaxID=670 RepID=UPI001DE54186|nr:carboxymuconolactone decarboxylase family protein [Vibrio parahaemolyticus]EHJ9992749.1 carboxymuconolactone decarboxylase family protein [Vibrio parahaemolyticus]MCG0008023.1 carboxymuconolactone decarboxylase family protein [Vibrio parahaemolyticus]MDL2020589.1 carboxymuconolactone decarboxylase family protein [Vibrio parahaemolyticus]MDL2024225.1 carboxymuconolactone decarboxylase family protein [Vibrio parahaemolyticus]
MPAFATDKLSNKERAIVPIAAFTASGDVEKLKISLNDGLESGLTINEIKEVLAQPYAYAGFPRSLNGLAAFIEVVEVVEVRKNRGITDILGRESTPLSTDKSSLELGSQNQTTLVGMQVKGPLFDFSPQIDQYLKAHLFGDIFARDLLTWKQREIATIAALANIKGVNSQLAAHYNISMNNGVSAEELNDFILVLKQCCDESIASNAQSVLDSVLDAKN